MFERYEEWNSNIKKGLEKYEKKELENYEKELKKNKAKSLSKNVTISHGMGGSGSHVAVMSRRAARIYGILRGGT